MKSKVRRNGCPENKHPQDKATSKASNAEEPQAPHQNSYHHQSMFVNNTASILSCRGISLQVSTEEQTQRNASFPSSSMS
jgi:hypothetical protein